MERNKGNHWQVCCHLESEAMQKINMSHAQSMNYIVGKQCNARRMVKCSSDKLRCAVYS